MTATTPPGRVVREGDAVILELTRDLPEPVERVWAALTDPAHTPGWIGEWSGDPASGTIDFTMTAEGVTDPQPVTVRECRAPERLALEMPGPEGPWPVAVVLSPTRGGDGEAGTSLRFTQELSAPYDASSIGPGWHYYLDRMVAVLRGEEPTTDFDAYYPATSGAYALPD
jgi:uncharacterized protein YndB with AHSA1/START domain